MPILTTPRSRLGAWGVSQAPGPFTGKTVTIAIAGVPTKRDGIFAYARRRDGLFQYATKRPGVLA